MILQVFVRELGPGRPSKLAFGSHPQIPEAEDDRRVENAAAANQVLRVVFDEIIPGNYFEEILCRSEDENGNGVLDADEKVWGRVPIGTTPDDVAACSPPELSACTAVCVFAGEPRGIQDLDSDGAIDDTRFIAGAIALVCGSIEIELDLDGSYYNPSGNQIIPAGDLDINGLGPAVVLRPRRPLPTSSQCTLEFAESVVDKDGIRVCAPAGGVIEAGCTPGDTNNVSFAVEPLRLIATNPVDGARDVRLLGDTGHAIITLRFNVPVDPATLAGVVVSDGNGNAVETSVMVDPALPGDSVPVTVEGGYQPNTTYTVAVAASVADLYGGTLPQPAAFSFTTEAPPPVDAMTEQLDAGSGP